MPRISDDKCPGEGLQVWLEAEEMQDRCWKVLVSVIQISVPSEAVPARHPRPNLADVM